jgi:exosortase
MIQTGIPPVRCEKMGRRQTVIKALILGLVLAGFYYPVFRWLLHTWLVDPYYSHGFAIIPVSVFLVWIKRKEMAKAVPSAMGSAILLSGLILYVVGFATGMDWLWALSLLPVLTGLVLYFLGTRAFRTVLFPICFLIFMIPLPFIDSLGFHLQYSSARWSADVATVLGIPVIVTGAEIRLGQSSLIVGPQCTGLTTIISLLTLASLFAYILKGAYWKRGIVVILSVPLAVIANIMRISILLSVAHNLGTSAAMNYWHSMAHLLVFLFVVPLLFIIARILGCKVTPLTRG